uniref:Uncharacterized protein n=1 Tax=Rhizophora mucronata TaxID=61149 RepID=A0A2P2J224_RHIMU
MASFIIQAAQEKNDQHIHNNGEHKVRVHEFVSLNTLTRSQKFLQIYSLIM